ncbi:hypothetical protein CDL15_Pgr006019 [Punica granatum]|nr:hypothetical protein CDL15_Pgr006019 [Punica granatum]
MGAPIETRQKVDLRHDRVPNSTTNLQEIEYNSNSEGHATLFSEEDPSDDAFFVAGGDGEAEFDKEEEIVTGDGVPNLMCEKEDMESESSGREELVNPYMKEKKAYWILDRHALKIERRLCMKQGELIQNFLKNDASQLTTSSSIAFYDDNRISINGDTAIAFTKSVDTRFERLAWYVIWVKNGNTGYDEIRAAIKEAKVVKNKPTLIKIMTTIGFGSSNKINTYSVYGSALGAKEMDATRKNLGWPYEPFLIPEDIKSHWSHHIPNGAALETEWNAKFAEYEKKFCASKKRRERKNPLLPLPFVSGIRLKLVLKLTLY